VIIGLVLDSSISKWNEVLKTSSRLIRASSHVTHCHVTGTGNIIPTVIIDDRASSGRCGDGPNGDDVAGCESEVERCNRLSGPPFDERDVGIG
jgi:hypothetical protein